MPELPEVENVKLSLTQLLSHKPKIKSVNVMRRNLRFPVPTGFEANVKGQVINDFGRRAKYLIFDLGKNIMLSHLGMSGSWRLVGMQETIEKHDHISIQFSDNTQLLYNDPRRFGYIDLFAKEQKDNHPFLRHLGVEPLSEVFTANYLKQKSKNKKTMIKSFLMDQQNVVGVGNIYVAEALFLSGIRPTRKVHTIKNEEWSKLIRNIKKVLRQSILAGGTTLRDYSKADGTSGSFQFTLFVYGREKLKCMKCKTIIKNTVISNRSSFWCAKCQK
jgi:formamidopyrimidine-DNA glycosylase